MSEVLDFFRSKSPGLKDVPDEELTQFIAETHPEFVQSDPTFAKRVGLVQQKVAAEKEAPSVPLETGKAFGEEVLKPFVPIPRPEVTPEEHPVTQIVKGLTRAGINLAEGIETPAAVASVAATGIPVVGPVVGKALALGFGGAGVKQASDQLMVAWQNKDLGAIAEGIGNLIASGGILAGGMGAIKPNVTPLTEKAAKGEPVSQSKAPEPTSTTTPLTEAALGTTTKEQPLTVYHGGPPNALQSNWPKWWTTNPDRANAYGLGNVHKATVQPENPFYSKVTLSIEDVEKKFSEGHDAIIIGSKENPIDVIVPNRESANLKVEGDPNAERITKATQPDGPSLSQPEQAAGRRTEPEGGVRVPAQGQGQEIQGQEEAAVKAEPLPAEQPPFVGATQLTPGVAPPGISAGQVLSLPGVEKLDTARRGISELWKTEPTKREVAATFDAAGNEAAITGRQAASEMRLVVGNNPLDRQAMTAVVQAGDEAKMAADNANVQASNAPQSLKDVYRYAETNFDRLNQAAGKANDIHDRQLQSERAAGVDVDQLDNYVAQRWDFDVMLGRNKPVILDATGGKSGSTFFRKQRVFPDYATGIAAGYVPKTLDITDLIDHRVRAGQMMINKKAWAESLRGVNSPLDGNPLVTDLIRQPKGTLVPPQGYQSMDLFGQRVAVNESFAPIVKALTGTSSVPKAMMNVAGGIKHGMLLFDLFHMSRLMQMAAAANRDLPSFRKGLSILEYNDADLTRAVAQNEITQEMADYSRQYRPVLEAGVKAGLNVGRISDALYKDATANIPFVGKTIHSYNKFLFDKLQRGLMSETYINWRASNAEDFPNLSGRELDFKTANEVNTFYRNLNSQGVFKSQTWKDLARLSLLAPQWLEGGVATELRSVAQTGKIPLDAVTQQTFRIGNLAKTTGTGLLAYMAIAQTINLATRGKPTWENPEKGHKLDAYIPDWLSGSEGYFMSPLTVFGETSHDWIRYQDKETSQLGVAARIIGNKAQPVIHATRDLFMGKDFFNKPLGSDWERIKQAAIDLTPEPIPAKSLHGQYKGQAQRTLLSTAGLKVEPAPTVNRQIVDLAHDFNQAHGIKPDLEYHASDYAPLKKALDNGDMADAQKQLDKLRASKPNKTIRTYFDHLTTHPFTGSRARETQFKNGLSEDQLLLYNQAREANQRIKQRFHELQ